MFSLKCTIVSPEKEAFKGDVDYINLPGSSGDFGVLSMHVPLITTLNTGIVSVIRDSNEYKFVVVDSYFEIDNDIVTIIADEVYTKSDINYDKTVSLFEEIRNKISDMRFDDPEYETNKMLFDKYESMLKLFD